MTSVVFKVLLAGIPLAVAAALLGSLIQWRRMSFVGDAMAHSALLGIAISLLFGVSIQAGILVTASLMATFVLVLTRSSRINRDAALAVGAHAALASGIFLLYAQGSRVDWESVLFGNILSLTTTEVVLMAGMSAVICVALWWLWDILVLMAVNVEIVITEHANARKVEVLFMLLVCIYVAIGVQAVGALLLNSLMIIPAAAARPLAKSPQAMAIYGACIGAGCIIAGAGFTFSIDVPMAPASVLAASVVFGVIWTIAYARRRRTS